MRITSVLARWTMQKQMIRFVVESFVGGHRSQTSGELRSNVLHCYAETGMHGNLSQGYRSIDRSKEKMSRVLTNGLYLLSFKYGDCLSFEIFVNSIDCLWTIKTGNVT